MYFACVSPQPPHRGNTTHALLHTQSPVYAFTCANTHSTPFREKSVYLSHSLETVPPKNGEIALKTPRTLFFAVVLVV